MSEAEFQQAVVDAARTLGWHVQFTPDWMMRLAVHDMHRKRRGDRPWPDKGFPDLVLVRGTQIVVAELKSDKGRVRPEQQAWLAALRAAGVKAVVWRPRMWDDVLACLA